MIRTQRMIRPARRARPSWRSVVHDFASWLVAEHDPDAEASSGVGAAWYANYDDVEEEFYVYRQAALMQLPVPTKGAPDHGEQWVLPWLNLQYTWSGAGIGPSTEEGAYHNPGQITVSGHFLLYPVYAAFDKTVTWNETRQAAFQDALGAATHFRIGGTTQGYFKDNDPDVDTYVDPYLNVTKSLVLDPWAPDKYDETLYGFFLTFAEDCFPKPIADDSEVGYQWQLRTSAFGNPTRMYTLTRRPPEIFEVVKRRREYENLATELVLDRPHGLPDPDDVGQPYQAYEGQVVGVGQGYDTRTWVAVAMVADADEPDKTVSVQDYAGASSGPVEDWTECGGILKLF